MDQTQTDEARSAIPSDVERSERGVLLAELSNAIVRLHKQSVGKGPTKARSYFLGDEGLVCVLRGGFTRAEQTLQEHGREDIVNATRSELQASLQEAWIDAVEATVGRRVASFMSASDPQNGVQVETFLFEPETPDLENAEEGLIAEAGQVQRQARRVRDEMRALRDEQVQARETLRKRRESMKN